MNTNDIDLPPLPSGNPTYEFPDGAYDSEQMHQYATAAIEADRKTYNSIGEGTIQQLHDVLLYLQNETMKLEAAYGSNFKKEATEKARTATEKMKEAVYAIKNIDRKRRGEPVAWLYIGPSGNISAAYETVPNLDLYVLAKSEGGKIKPVYEAPQPAEPRLDAPAQVGHTRFGEGVPWATVIGAAQRYHAIENTPTKEQERIKKGAERIKVLQLAEPVKVPSDDIDIEDVRQYLDSWGCLAHPGVRALLARYGDKEQT